MTSPSPPNSIFDIDALERGELKVLSRDVYSSNQLSYTISEEKTDTERETNIETDTDTSNHDGTWWRVVMGFIVLLIFAALVFACADPVWCDARSSQGGEVEAGFYQMRWEEVAGVPMRS